MIKIASKEAARLMHSGTIAMAELEGNGIRVDVGYLKTHTKHTEKEIADIKKRLYADKTWKTWDRKYGHKAKLSSREQLGAIVFGDMKYKRRHGLAKKDRASEDFARRTPKNDEVAFQDVDLPFVKDYFRWQKLEKLYGTYLLGITREVVDGRIHPFFDSHKVISYRSSSSMINFQNIPNRNYEIARRIRKAFIPDVGCATIEDDYSTAEVRAACCYNLDPNLISYIENPKSDMHGDTAMEILGVTAEMIGRLEGMTDEQWAECNKLWKKGPRDWAKNRFVFPEFFGSTYFQCAPHIWEGVISGAMMPHGDMTIRDFLKTQGIKKLGDCDPDGNAAPGTFVHRVKQVEDSFWNKRFQTYTAWKKRWWNNYLNRGWFETLSGFVYSGIYGKNDCLNYGIQGFAFHWLLKSVIYMIAELKRRKMKTKMIGQIHDCMLASVPNEEIDEYMSLSSEVMTKWIPKHWPSIIVPLDCEVECCPEGTSWAEKSVWINKGGKWGEK